MGGDAFVEPEFVVLEDFFCGDFGGGEERLGVLVEGEEDGV